MYLVLIDNIYRFIESIMFVVAANACVSKIYKKSNKQLIIFIILLELFIILITYFFGNSNLYIITIHIAELLFIILAYKNDNLRAIIGYSIVYLIIGINTIISYSTFMFLIDNININVVYTNILIIYLPKFFTAYLILKNMPFIYRSSLFIKSRVTSIISLIITTLTIDFSISFLFIYNNINNLIFKETLFVFLSSFIIFLTLYFSSIDQKTNNLSKLNKELRKKINELKKIKHDYGSQISYLYGTYLMKDYERLGKLFKGIIDNHDITSKVKVVSSDVSLITKIINSIDLKDIDVIIDENVILENTYINELDLHKVISNIVRNSIDALQGKGLITIKSYYEPKHMTIHIQNNGPKINKNIINKIFEEGFSTKDNKNGDNGFGLYIVREIIHKYSGHITVTSNENSTTFSIKFPSDNK